MTPAQRHRGEDKMILKKCHDVYEQARQNDPNDGREILETGSLWVQLI